MNSPANQPTIVSSGGELKKAEADKKFKTLLLTANLINWILIFGSLTALLNAVLLTVRGNPLDGMVHLIFAGFIGMFAVGLYSYTSLTETISRLHCQDLNERKLRPLFAKLQLWKKLPGSRGTPYFCTAGTLTIFRAFLGDTDVAVRELREILDEQTKYSKSWSTSYTKTLANQNTDINAVLRSNLGHLLILQNEFAEAELKLEEAIAIYESENKKSIAEVYARSDLARIMIDRLEFAQALEQLDIAMERLRDNGKSTIICLNIDIEVIICKAYSAVCHYKLGRDDIANALKEEVISILPTGPTKWTFIGAGHAISMLAHLLIEREEIADAEQIIYLSSSCLTCETHPDFLEFKGVSDEILKKLESRK